MSDTPDAFAKALLARLNIQPTAANMRALVGWTKAEGGHWHNNARYNPLNTTQPEPGAGNTGSQGNIKVYKNWHQGIDATAKTLLNGRYDNILKALRHGSSSQIAAAIGSSPWGTNPSLVAKTIGSTSAQTNSNSLSSLPGVQYASGSGSRTVTTSDPDATKRVALARYLQSVDPNNLLLRLGAISVDEPTVRTREVAVSPAALPPASRQKGAGVRLQGGMSPLLELIHNGKQAFAVKNGQKVDPSVYSAVWANHANHVHVAAGPNTIVRLGKLAQQMGLHVSENPHFGGVTKGAHVADSYHYKGEAIDVSGDAHAMDEYAAEVERIYGLRK